MFVGGQGQMDEMRGNNVTTTWIIDGSNTGLIGSIRFDAIESIEGGSLADSFRLTSSESSMAWIDGGAGVDNLYGPADQNLWTLTGLQAGTLNDRLQFTAVENLIGGSQDDLFQFDGGTGFQSINGGAAFTADIIDYSAVGTPVAVDLRASSASFVSSMSGIEHFVGTNSTRDQLQGRDVNQTWTISDGSGSVGSIQFSSFEQILGGTANDVLVTSPSVVIGTTFDGGTGTDTLIGPNSATVWLVDSLGGGNSGNLQFSNVENLTGGASHDRFKFTEAGRLNGNLSGGVGNNSLDYSSWTTAVDVNLTTRIGTAIAGTITNFSMLLGGSGADLLVAGSAASLLVGNGGNDRLVGGGGRNVLIGGFGSDRVEGLGGDDLIVGGRTAFDATVDQLWLILNEWKSTRTYDQRIANLTGVGTASRANGDVFLQNTPDDTVFGDDGAMDELLGGTGRDWYFADLEDQLLDRVSTGANTERVDNS